MSLGCVFLSAANAAEPYDEKLEFVESSGTQWIDTGVKLHWKRYLGTLPWRGNSQFIVDSIYSSRPEKPSATKAEPTIVNSTEMEAL